MAFFDRVRWAEILVFLLLLILCAFLVAYKIDLPAGDDLPRHLKNGELILAGQYDVLYSNTYSYVEPAQRALNHHWLFGVVTYVLYRAAGWGGLAIFKIGVILCAFSLLFYTTVKRANFWLVAAISVPTMLMLGQRADLRPELFSYVFMVIFLSVLFEFDDHPEGNLIWWLVPLQIVWVNTHLFFSIGPMLVAGFLLEKVVLHWKDLKNSLVVNKLVSVFAAVVVACAINPSGIAGALYRYPHNFPFQAAELLSITEFWFFQGSGAPIFFFMLMASFLVLSFFLTHRKSLFYVLCSVATIVVTVLAVRGIVLFAIIFMLVLTDNTSEFFSRVLGVLRAQYPRHQKVLRMTTVVLLVSFCIYLIAAPEKVRLQAKESGIGVTDQSLGSAMFFKENALPRPIFNDTDTGSYLIGALYPQEKVFSDNRLGDAYSASFFDDLYLPMVRDEAVWRQKLAEFGFNTIFLSRNPDLVIGGFLYRRMADPGWALVYIDRYVAIFVRVTQGNEELIRKFKITRDTIATRLEHLIASSRTEDQIVAADILYFTGRADLGKEIFLRVATKHPERGDLWTILGQTEFGKTDPESSRLAAMYFEKALIAGQKRSVDYMLLGVSYMRLGRTQEAVEALGQALKIDPDNHDAQQFRESIIGTGR